MGNDNKSGSDNKNVTVKDKKKTLTVYEFTNVYVANPREAFYVIKKHRDKVLTVDQWKSTLKGDDIEFRKI